MNPAFKPPVFANAKAGTKRPNDDLRESGGTLMYTMDELFLEDEGLFPEGDHDDEEDEEDDGDPRKKRQKATTRNVSELQKLERRCDFFVE